MVTYWRSANEGDLADNLKEAQRNVQKAIMDRNYDEFKKYVSEDMKLISGDSNLQDFYEFSEESFSRNSSVSWESFNLRDIDVSTGVYVVMLSDLDTYETKTLKIMIIK